MKKFENYLIVTFTALKKTEEKPISSNFSPNNFNLYIKIKVDTHPGYNNR